MEKPDSANNIRLLQQKFASPLDILLWRIQEIPAWAVYESPYSRSTLHTYIRKIGFQYQKTDIHKVKMESLRLVSWQYKYLIEIARYRSKGYLIVCLDETWFGSQDIVNKLLSDRWRQCPLSGQPSRDKRVVICHAGSNEGFVNGALLLYGKKLSESFANYHDDINRKVFKDWFGNVFLPKLAKERNVVFVMDNDKYHSRLIEWLMAKKVGYEGLWLSPYHCVLNLIEIVWNQLKCFVRHFNVYASQSSKQGGSNKK